MKYKISLENSWMGDTLLACNVVKNLTDMGYDIELYYRWPFMRKFIELFDIQAHLFLGHIDFENCKPRIYTQRIDVFDHPLLDYAKCFNIEGADLERASKFYPLDKPFKNKYNIEKPDFDYITYDHDWQLRTGYNVENIINELSKIIKIIPVGGDRFDNNPDYLIKSGEILLNSKLHLGMIGGTTNLAAFMNTKTIGDSQHLYTFYKTQGESHNYMEKESLNPEKFLSTFKPFPTYWADPKHIAVHPNTTENEYINIIKNNL